MIKMIDSRIGNFMWNKKYIHLDDLLEPLQVLAREFKDLTQNFDQYMGPSWQKKLIVPDPAATGKTIKSTEKILDYMASNPDATMRF